MRKFLLVVIIAAFSIPAQAGIRVGPYLSAGMISYDDIDAATLERESRSAPIAHIGINVVHPILSGVFISGRLGGGIIQSYKQTAPAPPGSTTGPIDVKSNLRVIRAALDLSSLIGESTFLFAGAGYDMMRLRFTGDINEVNADANEAFVEAGVGYMFSDDHLLRFTGCFNTNTTSVLLSYTVFLMKSGY